MYICSHRARRASEGTLWSLRTGHEPARLIAQAFDGVWLPFHAPATLNSEETRASLFQSGHIARMAGSWKGVNVAFVGKRVGHR